MGRRRTGHIGTGGDWTGGLEGLDWRGLTAGQEETSAGQEREKH